MSSFVGLYTGLSGIQAAQTGLDITSHNVANANTPGYTRQRVELAPRPTYQSPNGRIGTGVNVDRIARLRDNFLDDRFRAALGGQAEAAIRAEFHTSLEFLSGEPDLGLTTRIDKLWGAAEAWANDPNDPATRRQVLTELASITDGFQATALAWDRLGEDTAARREVVVTQANDTLVALADMNRRLTNADPSRVGADLLDQRDLLVDQLAQLVGSTARLQADGSVTITLGTTELLSGANGAASFTTDTTPAGRVGVLAAGAALGDAADDVTASVSGELGGLNRVIEEDLLDWRRQLNELATTFAGAVNTINRGGVLSNGDPGLDLLTFDAVNAAGTLERATDQIGALAAAVTGAPPAPFDGSNARKLADLRTTRLGPEDSTLESRIADLVVGLAGEVRSSRSAADAARGVSVGAQLARAAEHGVSIDEEMVGLVRYQRALEAAARVMTTVDQALDTLVNRVGIVGR
jgi:flagellar hook-associated protein 1